MTVKAVLKHRAFVSKLRRHKSRVLKNPSKPQTSVRGFLTKLDFSPDKEELIYLKRETAGFVELLRKGLAKTKVDADVFVGGSFAKGTLAESSEYDIDVFVRFDWKHESLSELLEKVVKNVSKEMKLPLVRLHGSRDYFRVTKGKLTFEIIPVKRVKNVKQSDNVTDLSYFHVNYVKKNLKSGSREVGFAKKFCKAQGVYGAESYINGFSGYGLECLIIHYGGFEKMLRELVKVGERIVLDPGKRYSKKDDAFFEMNESKLHSPIILVDPTWKERNVLAALSWETFRKFQERARMFLKNPSEKFFVLREFDFEKMKGRAGKGREFVHVVLETDRQEGDIAGTKMKKFSRFLIRETGRYFDVLEKEFVYLGGQKADFYLVVKPKKKVVRAGPSLEMKGDVKKFKSKNKKTFVEDRRVYSRVKVDFSCKTFLESLKKKYGEKVRAMGVVSLTVPKS